MSKNRKLGLEPEQLSFGSAIKLALLGSGGTLPPRITERPATLDAPPPLLPSPFELFESPGADPQSSP